MKHSALFCISLVSLLIDVIIVNMAKATKIFQRKIEFADGCILQGVIWLLPDKPVFGSYHQYKYRLYYGCSGKRDIGYDNERGKGDHRHYGDHEEPYLFSTPETLLDDFFADVMNYRSGGT